MSVDSSDSIIEIREDSAPQVPESIVIEGGITVIDLSQPLQAEDSHSDDSSVELVETRIPNAHSVAAPPKMNQPLHCSSARPSTVPVVDLTSQRPTESPNGYPQEYGSWMTSSKTESLNGYPQEYGSWMTSSKKCRPLTKANISRQQRSRNGRPASERIPGLYPFANAARLTLGFPNPKATSPITTLSSKLDSSRGRTTAAAPRLVGKSQRVMAKSNNTVLPAVPATRSPLKLSDETKVALRKVAAGTSFSIPQPQLKMTFTQAEMMNASNDTYDADRSNRSSFVEKVGSICGDNTDKSRNLNAVLLDTSALSTTTTNSVITSTLHAHDNPEDENLSSHVDTMDICDDETDVRTWSSVHSETSSNKTELEIRSASTSLGDVSGDTVALDLMEDVSTDYNEENFGIIHAANETNDEATDVEACELPGHVIRTQDKLEENYFQAFYV